MSHGKGDILVVGAGVSGLTTAVCLAEAGFPVRVVARHQAERTTSYAAGAIWGPYLAAHERAAEWSDETLAVLENLAGVRGSGVRLVPGVEAATTEVEPPAWATAVRGFQPCSRDQLPGGFVSGWSYSVPVIDMPVYLGHLTARLSARGVTVQTATVRSLEEAGRHAPVVVNCAGMGARGLVPDPDLMPVRGDLLVVDNPGVERFFAEHSDDVSDLTYLLPHGDHLVLGGTAQPGRFDLDPDPKTSSAILRRCLAIEPSLRTARVRDHRVGLRPTRPRIRVEHAPAPGYHVLHNYGHGGAGVSLSWGCAGDILTAVQNL